MYYKVFEFDQKVQKKKNIQFVWYLMKHQLPKIVKFHHLSNFTFSTKIRIEDVRFLKNKLSDIRSRKKVKRLTEKLL